MKTTLNDGGVKDMKVAVSTDDGATICGHLGRASKFFIYSVKSGEIVSRELREVTPVHGPGEHHQHGHGHEHGHHHHGHGGMIESLSDVDAIITNGMGAPFADALRMSGIDPVVTAEKDPDTAVRAYIEGTLSVSQGCNHCQH